MSAASDPARPRPHRADRPPGRHPLQRPVVQPPRELGRPHLRALWPRNNEWGIPELEADDFEPTMLAAYHEPKQLAEAAEQGGAVHTFLDDYRFEAVWNTPERALERIRPVGAALTPDFSLYRGMPLAMQLWQVYRSRWVGVWWQYHGLRVIPTVCWSTPESYEFCFVGIPRHAPVALSAVGVRDAEARLLFRAGLQEMLRQVEPTRLVLYGSLGDLTVGMDVPPVREYEPFHRARGWRCRGDGLNDPTSRR